MRVLSTLLLAASLALSVQYQQLEASMASVGSSGSMDSSLSSYGSERSYGSGGPAPVPGVGETFSCNFGSEWVLPMDKMTDASIKSDVREALSKGTKVCFCHDVGASSQAQHTAVCRSESTGAWSAQTALGQDKIDDANCFCMKGLRAQPPANNTESVHVPDDGHEAHAADQAGLPQSYEGYGSQPSHGSHHSHDHRATTAAPRNSYVGSSYKHGGSSYHSFEGYGSSYNMHLPSTSSYMHGSSSYTYDSHQRHDSHATGGSHGSHHHAKCVPCDETRSRPMGVHCYESYDAFTKDPATQLTSSHPTGHVCPGTQFTLAYTCGDAYDGYFANIDATSGECQYYSTVCCGSAPSTTPAAGSRGGSHTQHGSYYGSQQHGGGSYDGSQQHSSQHTDGTACDREYCPGACFPFIYCMTAPNASCAYAPTDCDTRCSGCAEAQAAVQNASAAGSMQHDMTGGVTNDGSMKSDHGSHNTGAGSMQHDMTGGATNDGSMKSDHGSHNTGAAGSMQHDMTGGATTDGSMTMAP